MNRPIATALPSMLLLAAMLAVPCRAGAAATGATRAASAAAAAAAPAQAAPTQAAPAPGAPINTLCPVLTDEDVDPRFTVPWRGVTVGLCCAKCQRKFLADPEAYAVNLPPLPAAPAAVAALAGAPQDGGGTPAGGAPGGAPGTQTAPAGTPAPVGAGAGGEDGEEHEAEHEEEHEGLEALFARCHVLLVHFPIAMLLGAALAELLAALFVSAAMSAAARFCAFVAAITAPITALSGIERSEHYTTLPGLAETLEWHRYGGIGTAALALLIALLAWRAGRKNASPGAVRAFRWALVVAAVLVSVTAHFGGELVHGAGYPFE